MPVSKSQEWALLSPQSHRTDEQRSRWKQWRTNDSQLQRRYDRLISWQANWPQFQFHKSSPETQKLVSAFHRMLSPLPDPPPSHKVVSSAWFVWILYSTTAVGNSTSEQLLWQLQGACKFNWAQCDIAHFSKHRNIHTTKEISTESRQCYWHYQLVSHSWSDIAGLVLSLSPSWLEVWKGI